LAAHALGRRAEDVGQVVTHAPLVGEPREPPGARQYAEQRYFRQRHGGGAIVHEQDLVAGERKLVAAAGAGSVDGGDELEAGVPARVLDAVARLVRELAEVHFPGVARAPEHEDVRAGAEHPLARAGQDDRAHLGMLEANALQRVVQLDVDAEIVGVQLELVSGANAGILCDVHGERRDRAVERKLPMPVTVRMRCEIDAIRYGRYRGGDGTVHQDSVRMLRLARRRGLRPAVRTRHAVYCMDAVRCQARRKRGKTTRRRRSRSRSSVSGDRNPALMPPSFGSILHAKPKLDA
jgi:hypothetical protein